MKIELSVNEAKELLNASPPAEPIIKYAQSQDLYHFYTAMTQKRKVSAIKFVRAMTGMGLTDSKTFVEDLVSYDYWSE